MRDWSLEVSKNEARVRRLYTREARYTWTWIYLQAPKVRPFLITQIIQFPHCWCSSLQHCDSTLMPPKATPMWPWLFSNQTISLVISGHFESINIMAFLTSVITLKLSLKYILVRFCVSYQRWVFDFTRMSQNLTMSTLYNLTWLESIFFSML